MDQDDRSSLISRIGTFFILLGLLGVILFVASDIADRTNFTYFILAIILFAIAWLFKRTGNTTSLLNKRFEGVRKLQQSRRDANDKNDKNKKEINQ